MPDNDANQPTATQVAWVFERLVEHYEQGGTFRALVKRMGFAKEYPLLYQSGGLLISNLIWVAGTERRKMQAVANQVFGVESDAKDPPPR